MRRRIFSLNVKAGDIFRWQYARNKTFLALTDGNRDEFRYLDELYVLSSSDGTIYPLLIGRRDWVEVIE